MAATQHRSLSLHSAFGVGMTGPHTFSVEKSVSAIDGSPDGTMLAVVGRDILQIMEWKERNYENKKEHWNMVKNFRVGRLNLNYSSVDVQWNPTMPQFIGTAATNGAIIIWNVNRDAKKQERVIKEHMRAVNRICWKKSDGNLLLSASQDGTVRLFDLRDPSVAQIFSTSNSEVRDVQFHPYYSNYFASANDNGTIQLWDIRKSGKEGFRRTITAHQGLLLAIDWHPAENYKNLLASAGRDRLVKVWDLESSTPSSSSLQASHIFQTIASVGRVKWRPNFPSQLCSTHSVVDSRIHIWDTKHPNIPVYSLSSHTDVATGIVFDVTDTHSNTLISGSKDGTIKRFKIKTDSYKHFDHIPNSALDWTPSNKLSFAHEPVVRPSKKNRRSSQWMSSSVSALNFESKAQFEAQSSQELFSPSLKPGKNRYLLTTSLPKIPQVPVYNMFNSDVFMFLAKGYKLAGAPLKEICEQNAKIASSCGQKEISQVWEITKLLFCVETKKKTKKRKSSNTFWDAYYDIIFDEPFSVGGFDEPESNSVLSSDPELEYDSVMLLDPIGLDESIFEQTATQKPYFAPKMKVQCKDEMKPLTLPAFQFTEMLNETLAFHAHKGDVQTSVSVLIALGKKFTFPDDLKCKWVNAYIELLQRFELFTVANEVTKECAIPSIRSRNQKGTTFQVGCSVCKKTLNKKAWVCNKCNATKSCSICSQPVKGLYVWCQGCGHGGHLAHVHDWFKESKICPIAGCEHICTVQQH